MQTERVSLINSNVTTLTNDYDFSMFEKFLTGGVSGVLYTDITTKPEFALSGTGTVDIAPGKALIKVTRATSSPIANQDIMLRYELSETKSLSTTSGDSIFIEIDQTLIDTPTLIEDTYPSTTYALGKGIGELKSASTLPVTNPYLLLHTNSGGVWSDVRVGVKVSDDAVNLPINQDFIDLQTEVTDNTNAIAAISTGVSIAKKLCGENIAIREQVFLEQRPEYTDIDVLNNQTNNNSSTASAAYNIGVKITSNMKQILWRVRKHAASTATTAYVYDATGTSLLATSSAFSGDYAVINYQMQAGTAYVVSCNAGGGSYTYSIKTSPGYPTTVDSVTYTEGRRIGTGTQANAMNVYELNMFPGEVLGDVTANTYNSIKFVGGDTEAVSKLKFGFTKVGSPADNITLRIETDSAGKASGTLMDANATSSVAGSTITAGAKNDVSFTLAGNVTFVKGTVYHAVFSRDGAINNSNYYVLISSKYHSTTRGTNVKGAGAWGTETSYIPYMDTGTGSFTRSKGEERGLLSLTDADYIYKTTHYGQFADTSGTIGQEKQVYTDGIVPQVGLTYVRPTTTTPSTSVYKGQPYALSATPGAITTQTNTYGNSFIGYSLSPTELQIIKDGGYN